jgi:hypothetical protein
MEQFIDNRRITLVAHGTTRDWEATDLASSSVLAVDELQQLLLTLVDSDTNHLKVERVILDGVGTASEFLDLLTAMPSEFAGDTVMIREDGSALLSSTARSGNRVLYGLAAPAVDFYLQVNGLVPFDMEPELMVA